eukprot:scaffold156241_cov32-Tisochrysis_lutea.AAC.3
MAVGRSSRCSRTSAITTPSNEASGKQDKPCSASLALLEDGPVLEALLPRVRTGLIESIDSWIHSGDVVAKSGKLNATHSATTAHLEESARPLAGGGRDA